MATRYSAFEVLGLELDAQPELIRKAFRERVKEVHPDHGGRAEDFVTVRRAYDLLCDPQKRAHMGDLEIFNWNGPKFKRPLNSILRYDRRGLPVYDSC